MKKSFSYIVVLVIFSAIGCGEPPESPYHVWNLGTINASEYRKATDSIPANSNMGQTYIFTAGVAGSYVVSFTSMSNPNARLSWYIDEYPTNPAYPAVLCYKSSTESGVCLTESLEAGKSYQVIVYEWNGQATGYTIRIDAPL